MTELKSFKFLKKQNKKEPSPSKKPTQNIELVVKKKKLSHKVHNTKQLEWVK